MPVVKVNMREGPDNVVPAQALGDDRIFINVKLIIVVYEVMADCLAEYNPDGGGKK